jgi:hypothetical protein
MTTEYRRRREPPVDREPELTHYQDDGCFVWHACLSCPLPQCIYDDPRGPRIALHRDRNTEIGRLSREGWSRRALAARFGLSRRQVFRILRREREDAS